MSASKLSSVIAAARAHINEKTPRHWTDDELLEICTRGITDLWAEIVDLRQEHFLTIDETNVYVDTDNDELQGVPSDVFRVYLIEPRDISDTAATPFVVFVPRPYNHAEFVNARSWSSIDPINGMNIFYDVMGAGAPQGAPTIKLAPTTTSQVLCRFAYIPNLAVANYTVETQNPIPGESNNALIAWTAAYAWAKVRDDHMPDPAWLAVYSTEKQSLLKRLTPRQEQEPQVVDGLFDLYWRY